MSRLNKEFFQNDAVYVAQNLLAKILVRVWEDGTCTKYVITETEAYMGEEDKACHASKGRSVRTQVMYAEGGLLYVYLIYGLYWMLNFVTNNQNEPQAVLIRGINEIKGPGKVGRELKIDKSFYAESLFSSKRIWVEDTLTDVSFEALPRVGIDYAGYEWANKAWRFVLK